MSHKKNFYNFFIIYIQFITSIVSANEYSPAVDKELSG